MNDSLSVSLINILEVTMVNVSMCEATVLSARSHRGKPLLLNCERNLSPPQLHGCESPHL